MAKRKRRKKKQQEREGLGEAKLLGAALGLALVAYFLKDASGVQYRLVGSYIWAIAFIFALIIFLFYYAQFILPLRWQDSWYEGLRLSIGYNFPILASFFGARTYRPPRANAEGVDSGISPGIESHGAGMVDSDKVLALTKGQAFTRAVGPGYVSLNQGESIGEVLDLRRHVRSMPVSAMTRDGIPLETTVSVVFQVKHEEEPADYGLPYPYDTSAIFHVSYVGNYHSEAGSLPWSERVCRQAASALVAELALYALDELFLPDHPDAPPIETVESKLKNQMATTFDPYGIAIISVGIGQIGLPDSVKEQRIKNWQSAWQRRIQSETAASDTEAMRRINLARARAQIEIIESITENIDTLRRSGDNELSEIIALRLLQALNEVSADEDVQALVPPDTMATLRQIYDWIEEGSGRP